MKDLPKQEIKEAIRVARREIKEWIKFLAMCEKRIKLIDKKVNKKLSTFTL